jgi:transmembrane sensor
MENYSSYDAPDFAADTFFQEWVLRPNRSSERFWRQWLTDHPDSQSTLLEAAEWVIAIHSMYQDDFTEECRKQEIFKLFSQKAPKKIRWFQIAGQTDYRLRAVAVWILLSGLLGWYYTSSSTFQTADYTTLFGYAPDEMITRENRSDKAVTILLDDGSAITLDTGSSIRYPKDFRYSVRKVELTGNAFFDVARNTEKPFLVIAGETLTKVLGTSFRIKCSGNKVVVSVKTGQVSVRSNSSADRDITDADVLLTQNQQVVYDSQSEDFRTSKVEAPWGLPDMQNVQVVPDLEDTLVSELLRKLEKTYGVQITYNESSFSDCRITTQFTDETLRQKLQAICSVTKATFRFDDGRILIEGACQ